MYRKLKVDIGVHPDWPIGSRLDKRQATKRYRTTLQNAAIAMEHLQEPEYNDLNIKAVTQGTSPAMYRRCAERYISMGYELIGIGGLVSLARTNKVDAIISRIRAGAEIGHAAVRASKSARVLSSCSLEVQLNRHCVSKASAHRSCADTASLSRLWARISSLYFASTFFTSCARIAFSRSPSTSAT